MNKLIFVITLCVAVSMYGQEIVKTSDGKLVKLNDDKTWEYSDLSTYFKESDVIYSKNGNSMFDRTVKVKNGKNELIDATLDVILIKQYADGLNFEKIDSMIETSLLEAKYSLKNKSTFIPLKINFSVYNNQGVIISVEYSGQNDYGGTKYLSKVVFFDLQGNKIKVL